jgi:hypothetical protein
MALPTLPFVPSITCPPPTPRCSSQGIDSIEVSHDQRSLTVTFLEDILAGTYLYETSRYAIAGGRRLNPHVLSVVAGPMPRQLVLQLDQRGDFSIYTLSISGPDIDPFFATRRFSFKIECEDPYDCKPAASPAPIEPASPAIDYLTKDYAGFRQLLLDQLPARLPEWTERSEADMGVALVELFAEAADRLSYYQDRVANEAYLDTASQRRSVQLHTALIGYRMRPGVAASTYLFFKARAEALIAAGTQVKTRTQGDEPPVVFETGPGDFLIRPSHNLLTPYNWGKDGCCLPQGATEIAIVGDYSQLRSGDALLIADAVDPERREIVHLTDAPAILPPDPIKAHPTEPLTLLRWAGIQALQFDYCLDNTRTLMRGNLVPATHGETVIEEELGRGDESLKYLRLDLSYAPLTYVAPSSMAPPSQAVSTLTVTVDGEQWQERESLIESGPFDPHYRVELNDEGYATVVFSNGERGLKPPTGKRIEARYRVGIGPAGNVGRETLVVLDKPGPGIETVTNPLPARGGLDPEGKDDARRVAPFVIVKPQRCVTDADYEQAAIEYRENGMARVQRAKARFVWTGSWHTVFISVDPIGVEGLDANLRAGLYAYLNDRKLAGYDLEITASHYVPLNIGLRICVKPAFFASNVRIGLMNALSNRINPDGSRGFFHPDNFSFGQPVLLSRLYESIAAVPGVDSVVPTQFCRLHQPPEPATTTNLNKGYLPIGETEIARLDNDPSFPENGRLTLQLIGGK